MDKRNVTIEGTGVTDVMDGIAKFLRKVSHDLVDENYSGQITVAGVVDDKRQVLQMIFGKADVVKAETIWGMIQTLRENRGGSVALMIEQMNISGTVSDVELCLVYDPL
ncbi:hypothetical protein ACTG16_23580 [Aeromonas sp. 23P]|uniref:hypothetical protein n=1 Tax=Aeromonas sp. 23P TaxID=3452716 RepID=UPI003F7AA2E5|nr:hypothetical protein [Aeromonas veronii]